MAPFRHRNYTSGAAGVCLGGAKPKGRWGKWVQPRDHVGSSGRGCGSWQTIRHRYRYVYLVSAALRHRLPPRLHDNHHRADRDDRAHGEDTNEGQPVEIGSAEGQTPTEKSAEAGRFERGSQYILRRSTSIRGSC